MRICDPLTMNDWPIKKFFIVVISLLISFLGLVSLDFMKLQTAFLRQIIGFIYLTFIPGFTILRILKLHRLGRIETLLYAIGLSIATLILIGLFASVIYPLLNIPRPISLPTLVITISIATLILCILCYVKDKDFASPTFINIEDITLPQVLILCHLPIFAIVGSYYFMNLYDDNTLQLFLILLIALIAISIGFNGFFPKKLYPLAIFMVTIALLYHRSLISLYLTGSDIHSEYYLASLVKTQSKWVFVTPYSAAAMLSITILPSIYSILLDMSIVWVFKVIYPLLFSLVPLGMYRIIQKQIDEKIAFFSCFLMILIFPFYSEMISLARQEVAEFFLVLLVMTLINKKYQLRTKMFLLIIFGFSLISSHYALSFIYAFYIFILGIALIVTIFRKSKEEVIKEIGLYLIFASFFIGVMFAWYTFVASNEPIDILHRIWNKILDAFFNIFNPKLSEGTYIILQKPTSILASIEKYLHMIVGLLIVVGVFTLLFLKRKEYKMKMEYVAISLANFIILPMCIILPYFASELNITRFLQIAFIFLAPFCIIGWIFISEILHKLFKLYHPHKSTKNSIKALSIFLIVYLLFNTGFIYIVMGETSTAHPPISLDKSVDYPCFNVAEVWAVKWLKSKKDENDKVYADAYRYLLLNGYFGKQHEYIFFGKIKNDRIKLTRIPQNFVFLGTKNIAEKKLIVRIKRMPFDIRIPVNMSDIGVNDILVKSSMVYNNKAAQLYYINNI